MIIPRKRVLTLLNQGEDLHPTPLGHPLHPLGHPYTPWVGDEYIFYNLIILASIIEEIFWG